MNRTWERYETWCSISGYKNYLVSNYGRVRSLSRRVACSRGNGTKSWKGRILSPVFDRYLKVTLSDDGAAKQFPVHLLVLNAFVGPKPEHLGYVEGCHRDDNPRNNTASNLYWGTSGENSQDAIRNGRNHNKNKTSCINGHIYTEKSTFVRKDGKRWCRPCERIRLGLDPESPRIGVDAPAQ